MQIKVSDNMMHNVNVAANNAVNVINHNTEATTKALHKLTDRRNLIDLGVILIAVLVLLQAWGFFPWAHGAIAQLIQHAPTARR